MHRAEYVEIVARALSEDLGDHGDITSEACIPEGAESKGRLVARAPGVIAGLEVAAFAFETLDPSVIFEPVVDDGATVVGGSEVARVAGRSRPILSGERTALNLLGRMSGVATVTAELVDIVAGTGVSISDTRKTMPGLRSLDKYAVTVGGGVNHRFGLYDAVMIKDNHLVAVGSIAKAVSAARSALGPEMMVVVEVSDLAQLGEVLTTDADRVLLDNMSPDLLQRAVAIVDGRLVTEASGGITRENIREIAETGVDVVSVGWVTHSAPQLDIALDFLS